MEKAIEIKRRAQRCIQNGDLDGALAEYEKLVGFEDSDPYNFVLLADLLYKKGEQADAAERYLAAVNAYEKASLYKNAIAVCKKMTRLSLTPAKVLNALANLHALDGLAGEAALYYVQYAEHMVRSSAPAEAAHALRKAFDVCQDNVRVLEQLSEAWVLAGDQHQAALALVEAAGHYRDRGQPADATRVAKRAAQLDASVDGVAAFDAPAPAAAPEPAESAPAPEPAAFEVERAVTPAAFAADAPAAEADGSSPDPGRASVEDALELEPTSRAGAEPPAEAAAAGHEVAGFDSGRHDFAAPAANDGPAETTATAAPPEASPDDFAVSEADIRAYGAVDEPAPAAAEAHSNGDEGVQYVIEESSFADAVRAVEPAGDENPSGEPVYEITIDETADSAFGLDPAQAEAMAAAAPDEEAERVIVIEDESGPVETVREEGPPRAASHAPGLAFGAPGAPRHEPDPAHAQGRHTHHSGLHHATPSQEIGLQHVEGLLTQAQEQFRAGEREQASVTLARAAQAYEVLGRFDSAATIYRSLGRSATVDPAVLELWLVNCERRGDAKEAATVTCEMGDRALNAGDEAGARRWFERALVFDGQNDLARRRLQRLANGAAPAPAPVAAAPGAPVMEAGRVEVAVGRGEAVTFDLSGLLSEFQRGVEAQLAGDARSHYDLGMAYREMGLLEQAVDSFRIAVGEPSLAPRALEMIGRCHAEQGRWAEAVGEFRRALEHPIAGDDGAELRFHYAHALVELGENEAALAEYQTVAARLPGFEDVDARIAALRRVLGRA